MKEQIKQFFKKEWLNVTMYSVITLLLFCCMFWEPMVYVSIGIMVLFCIFRPVQHTFYLIFYTYSFYGLFYVFINNLSYPLYLALFYILVFIVGVRYLIDVISTKKRFNLYLFIISATFLLYCLLPFSGFKLTTYIQTLGIVVGLFLCYEYKKEISFNVLIYFASIGLIVSCLYSFVAFETPRMLSILTQFTNYGFIKFQGLFKNPNNLAIYCIFILPSLFVLYLKQHRWYVLFLMLASFVFAYMTLSRNFIVCFVITLFIYIILELVYYKKKGLLHVACVAVSMLALCAVMFTSTKIYLVRLGILPETSIVQIQQKSDAAVVLPGIPAEPNIPENSVNDEIFVDDPGREGLWERYWEDYTSNVYIVFFGRGISYPYIGNVAPHQGFLNILWQYGLVGTVLLMILVTYFMKNLLRKNNTCWFLLIPFLLTNLFETVLFRYPAFLFFVLIITNKEVLKYENN